MPRCRSCNARILWWLTTDDKAIPIEAEDMGGWEGPTTFEDGNLARTGESRKGRYGRVPVIAYVPPGEGRFKTHFASCPEAKEWRKKHGVGSEAEVQEAGGRGGPAGGGGQGGPQA